jgi:hypothetical protein
MAQIAAGAIAPLHELLDAFRSGTGVPYADYGHDLHEGQAGMTRPLFVNQMTQEWIPAMPEVDARLKADPPARIADIGMGQGWSSIALARGYPQVRVDGFDLDEASSRKRSATHGRPAWLIGSPSRSVTRATPTSLDSTIWPSPSSASTTCPTRSRY